MIEHPDAIVEKVLAGLRNAGPSPGMERRILDRLEAHSAPTSRRFHPIWWLRWRPIAQISFPGAIALACLLVIIAVMHRSVKTPARNASNLPAEIVQPRSAEPVKTASAYLPATPARWKAASAVRSTARIPPNPAPSTDSEEAASFPAPPMPITEQERLLLRMAHSRDVQSVAILRPEVRAKQEAVEIAKFEDFFKDQKIEVKNATAEQR